MLGPLHETQSDSSQARMSGWDCQLAMGEPLEPTSHVLRALGFIAKAISMWRLIVVMRYVSEQQHNRVSLTPATPVFPDLTGFGLRRRTVQLCLKS